MLVVFYRRDNSGASFYYSLDDRQQNLFNPYSLTVRWGTSPEGGHRKEYVFASPEDKDAAVRRILARKSKTHKILYSYFKESGASELAAEFIHREDATAEGPAAANAEMHLTRGRRRKAAGN